MADSMALSVACAKQTVSGQRWILGTMDSSEVTVALALHNMLCKRIGCDFDSSALQYCCLYEVLQSLCNVFEERERAVC